MKKLLTVMLVVGFLFGMIGGVVGAEEECPAAPAIAAEILRDAGVEQPGPLISQVARVTKGREAKFNDDLTKGEEGYREAVWNFLFNLGAVYCPSGHGGMVLWLDASALDLDDEGPVTGWNDLSGKGNNAIAFGSPTYKKEAINNLPAVQFDGESDYFTFPNSSIGEGSDITIFVVATPNGVSEGDVQADFVYGGHIYAQFSNVRYSSDNILRQHAYYSWDDEDGIRRARTVWGLPESVKGFSHVFTSTYDQGTAVLHLDGRAGANYQILGNYKVRDTWYIGAQLNFQGRYLDGDIAEIIIYNRALTELERQMVEAYLLAKYGLQ